MQRGEFSLRRAAAAVAIDQRRQVLTVEARGGGIHDHDALDHIANLAHVAGPGITHQDFDGVVGYFTRSASVGGGKFVEKMTGKERNIFFALAQGRYEEGNHVEAIKKIFAEVAPRYFFFQILVGRSDDPHIDGDSLFAADGREALLFQCAQDFRLSFQTHVSDFIEKERATVRLLKFSFLVGCRPGEGSAMVAEEFTLDQVLGNRGAVDLDKSLVASQALRVNGVRHQFLTGPGFTINQDTTVGGRHQANLLAQGLHGNAVAHDHTLRMELLFQVDVLAAQFLRFDRVLD